MPHYKQDAIAFVGTTMFIFLGLGGVTTAIYTESASQQQTAGVIAINNQTVMFISLSMGFSLLVNAWVFYRITGGLFNPSVTFALWAIGAIGHLRAVLLTIAQIAGGILGAGLVEVLIPYSINNTVTTLATGMNIGMGLMLEAFLTAMLVFTVLMLAAEKHKATFIAPIGIGLVLFVCQLIGTEWTGCGMNPARAFGPSVITVDFPGYHWIYWAGPYIGSIIAVSFYAILKAFDYGSVVLGQDSDDATSGTALVPVYNRAFKHMHLSHAHREAMAESGMSEAKINKVEKEMSTKNNASAMHVEAKSYGPPISTGQPKAPRPKSGVMRAPSGNNRSSSSVALPAPFVSQNSDNRPQSPTGKNTHATGARAQESGGIAGPLNR